ncbi:MAG: hypothetical protein FWB91_09430, partial [Defluviitaleaceae bacterium]|nr:hypothetical protein [Defluviitaleaceae bacterium]
MRIKKLLSITAVALSFMMVFSVLNAPMVLRAADEGENLTVTIFSIGDFHGFLTSEQSASDPGAPRFVTYVEEQLAAYESETGHRPIVVLAGDNYFGQSISNLFGGEPSLRV